MSDADEIRNLVARYNHAFDGRDVEAWVNCWAPDGVFVRANGDEVAGHEALEAFCRDSRVKGRHVVSSSMIDVKGDSATHSCYLQYLDRERDFGLIMFATYSDELRRVDGSWRFTRRSASRD